MIAIIGAMDEEVAMLKEKMTEVTGGVPGLAWNFIRESWKERTRW